MCGLSIRQREREGEKVGKEMSERKQEREGRALRSVAVYGCLF